MYLSTSRQAATPAAPEGSPLRAGRRGRIPATVLLLGTVSLITDVSSEMVTAVLPLYLVAGLGLSPLLFGFLDGLYTGATALARLVGGQVSDRLQRRKLVAGVGYGLSAVTKLGLLFAGGSVPAIGGVLVADRVGKGIRTAPRDALISLSSDPASLGRSFGVHRAMDTTGALAGPLVAFGLLSFTAGAFDAVFVTSFCIATVGVLVLALFVREVATAGAVVRSSTSTRAALGLLKADPFRRICICATLLGLVTVSDAFIYLLLQQKLGLDGAFFPLLPLGTALGYLLLAVPLGRLADRVGRWQIFVGGYGALLIVYLLLLGPVNGTIALLGCLALHGIYYAATDGVLMAVASECLPSHLRASGLALLATGQAIGRLFASILFGAAWTAFGAPLALVLAVAALMLATIAVLGVWRGRTSSLTRSQVRT